METEIVKTKTIFGDWEIIQEELREKTFPTLRKINKDGTKVWETKIGKTLKIISTKRRRIKHGK